jgi:hypothetical protein
MVMLPNDKGIFAMTDAEVQPFLNKPIRATLADGRILAGVLQQKSGHGHDHAHYTITSGPLRQGEPPVQELVHGATAFTEIDEAFEDQAARL